MSDQNPGAVQPEEGQGQQPDNGLIPDLSAVPENIRDQVTGLLKEYEGNVTRKFQEAADYRKQWEPYSELGLHDIELDDLKELLEFRQIAQDPDAFRDWYAAVGDQLQLQPGEVPAQQQQAPQGDDLLAKLTEALDQRLSPLEQRFAEQDQHKQLQEAESFVHSKLEELGAEHGEFDRDAVCQLALAYREEPDAIERGFADYQRLIGAAERNLLEGKLNTPGTPEQGGRPNSTPPEVRTFADAKVAATQLMQQAMQQ